MYSKQFFTTLSLVLVLILVCSAGVFANTAAPTSPVKLIFIHHSVGENWLTDANGDLGITLGTNNYFVSDTNYGWGPDSIGDRTDLGNWYDWFQGSNSATYLAALYSESATHSGYTRTLADPGGENQIIMFKSCFPNSHLGGNPTDAPTTGSNPLRGQDYSSEYMTVANAKGIYNDLLTYFATRQDKLFIAITPPPLATSDTNAAEAANARALSNWLSSDWLSSYPYHNVAVFDFHNVMTSNGGDANTNDLGSATGNHHRWWNGAVQHLQTVISDIAAYPTSDSHPSAAGNQKATAEFVPLLNYYYNLWHATPATTYRYYFPYYIEQTGYWTGVGLSNCSATQEATVTVTPYSQAGSALGGVLSSPTTLPADGQFRGVVSSGATSTVEGWMMVLSSQPLGGLCFFGTTGAANYMADITMTSTTATSLLIPHVAQNTIYDTILMICNPNGSAATATLTYVAPEGNSSTPVTQTIPAMGSVKVPLTMLVGTATAAGGKVKITSTQGIAAFALYNNLKSGGYCYSGIASVNPSGQ
jgi:hypothetical protein